MGQFFNGLVSKLLWLVVAVVAGGATYVWALNTILKPPQGAAPPIANSSPLPTASPVNDSAPFPNTSPVSAAPSPAFSPAASPFASPEASNSAPSVVPVDPSQSSASVSVAAPADTSQSPAPAPSAAPIPAIAQANDVVLVAPKKLEKGGKLRIFPATDTDNPDPLLSSPSRQINVPGLSLVQVDKDEFQEASGYFLVPSTGSYNFAVNLPKNFPPYTKSVVLVRVDGTALPDYKGGRLDLEKGWHEVRLFMNKQNYAFLNPNEVSLLWSREGDTLFPLSVWREAK